MKRLAQLDHLGSGAGTAEPLRLQRGDDEKHSDARWPLGQR